jgi:hypothetical protein
MAQKQDEWQRKTMRDALSGMDKVREALSKYRYECWKEQQTKFLRRA